MAFIKVVRLSQKLQEKKSRQLSVKPGLCDADEQNYSALSSEHFVSLEFLHQVTCLLLLCLDSVWFLLSSTSKFKVLRISVNGFLLFPVSKRSLGSQAEVTQLYYLSCDVSLK